MIIADILKQSAELLGLRTQVAKISTATKEIENELLTDETVASLMNLFQFSIQELCTNCLPVVNTAEIEVVENKFALGSLQNFIRIKSVIKQGEKIDFKVVNRNLVLDNGAYEVEYYTYPNIVSMFDEIDYLSNFSPDVMVFGLCAYFCLANGMFEDFKEFHARYVEKTDALKEMKIFNLPQRRWE